MRKTRGLLLAFSMTVSTMAPASEWGVGYTEKIGRRPCYEYSQLCGNRDAAPDFVPVCLYRDKSTGGLFNSGDWKAVINPADGNQCQEMLQANVPAKILFLEAPLLKSRSGQRYIQCAPGELEGSRSLCTSEFFKSYDANGRTRLLQQERIEQAIRESGLIAALDQFTAAIAKKKAEEEAATYRLAFENAKTLEEITAFETKYASHDPEGLISRLAELKRTLQIAEYRKRFASMSDVKEIEAFLADYVSDDPDGKIPEARRRLAEAQRKAAIAAKQLADQKIADEKVGALAVLESKIIWCKRQSVAARQTIDRENQIGLVSGYVNKLALHQAGEIIVSCEQSVPKYFAEYKQRGGLKSLAQLK